MNTIYRFGKHRKKEDPQGRTFQFAKYLTSEIPQPLGMYSNLQRVYDNLKINDPTKLFPIDGNDKIGDCTIAAIAHAKTEFSGLIGKKKIPSACSVKRQYRNMTGGKDTGLNMLDVMKRLKSNGMLGEKVPIFVEVDPKNLDHVRQAIMLFGGVYTGMFVQEEDIPNFRDRKPWVPGSLIPNEGHAIWTSDYDSNFFKVLTWGNDQEATVEWWLQRVEECYAMIPEEASDPNFTPGFNYQLLLDDLKSVQK